MIPNKEDELINEMVQEIFMQYDTNDSGYLEKREAFRLVNDVLAVRGQPPASNYLFNRIFREFDTNGDGVLSKGEITKFVKSIINDDTDNIIMNTVN